VINQPSPFTSTQQFAYFFENGGSKCFIVSVGSYTQTRNEITIHDELVGATVDTYGIPIPGGLKALEQETINPMVINR